MSDNHESTDESRLREALAWAADIPSPTPDWRDVEQRAKNGRRTHRARRLVAIAAVVVLITVAGSVLIIRNRGSQDLAATDSTPCTREGESLAVTRSGDGGDYSVWIDKPDRDIRRLTSDWVATRPSFSPDGERVAVIRADGDYESAGPSSSDIWTIRTDGTAPRQITDAAAGDQYDDTAWSPTGDLIAWSKYEPAASSGSWSIGTVPATGGAPRALTNPAAGSSDTAPAWSPDGQRIAYLRTIHPLASSESANSGAVSAPPSTSSPTETVTELRVIDRTGANDRLLAQLTPVTDAGVQTLDWSPDGSRLLVSNRTGERAAAVDTATGAIDEIGSGISLRWGGDGRAVYFITPNATGSDGTVIRGHIADGALVDDQTINNVHTGFLYPQVGIAVDRCR